MTWLTKPPLARILKGATAAWLLAILPVLASPAIANNWGEMAMVSETMGISDSRICIGEGSRGDLGCPSYAPTISPTGRINASAGLTVDSVSLTTTGTTWGYLGSAASYLPNLSSNAVSTTNISVSTINGVSISALGGSGGGSTPGAIKVFTSSGTYTKPAGLVAAKVTVIGGGGAGAGGTSSSSYSNAGGGGGGGAAQSVLLADDIPSSVTVTIGAGGSSGTGAGSAGGASSFSTLVVASGGSGASASAFSIANAGIGTTGQLIIRGQRGTSGGGGGDGQGGAAALLGVATPPIAANSGNGNAAAANTGAGGSGAIVGSSSNTGGAGGSGIVIVEEFFSGGGSGSSGGSSSTVVATTPAGSAGQIQYNTNGNFDASAGLVWDNSSSLLTAENISTTALTVNGVAITGGAGVSGDRITSGTTSMVANPSGTIEVNGGIQLMSATTAPVCTAETAGTIARINGRTYECRM